LKNTPRTKISDALGVKAKDLWKQGVFNAYLALDSRLHVDPALLRRTRIPEFVNSRKEFEDYFRVTFSLLRQIDKGPAIRRAAIHRLTFHEIKEAAIGYGSKSNMGRGISLGLGEALVDTASQILDAGIDDPAVFELVPLFEEGFGADLLSDMTIFVLAEQFSRFNQRICKKMGIATSAISVGGRDIVTAFSKPFDRRILLLPKALLSKLPVALDRDDIDRISTYNERVRQRVTELIGPAWRTLARLPKSDLKKLLIKNPEFFRAVIASYREKNPTPYSFEGDPLGVVLWELAAERFTNQYPLTLTQHEANADVVAVVKKICEKFRWHIEQHGGRELLVLPDGTGRPERCSQILFYAVADGYCAQNDLDLSREPNAGRGPVDFKISRGYVRRVVVELKLSSNPRGLDGLLAQLPTYAEAEQSLHSIFVVIKTDEKHQNRIASIQDARNRQLQANKRAPDLYIVDATPRLSASKLRLDEELLREIGEGPET